MDTVAYNEFLRQKFEKTKDIEVLLRYVISETLSPIGDYENAVKIVREYKDDYQNPILLFIGAYWLIWWYHEKENDCLQDLNRLKDRMTEEELAITYYLNASHVRATTSDYAEHPEYRENLLRSIECKVPFVNNRMDLAEISTGEERERLYAEALNNVVKVNSMEEIMAMPWEAFAEPDKFISEFITGTHPNDTDYKHLVRSAASNNERER